MKNLIIFTSIFLTLNLWAELKTNPDNEGCSFAELKRLVKIEKKLKNQEGLSFKDDLSDIKLHIAYRISHHQNCQWNQKLDQWLRYEMGQTYQSLTPKKDKTNELQDRWRQKTKEELGENYKTIEDDLTKYLYVGVNNKILQQKDISGLNENEKSIYIQKIEKIIKNNSSLKYQALQVVTHNNYLLVYHYSIALAYYQIDRQKNGRMETTLVHVRDVQSETINVLPENPEFTHQPLARIKPNAVVSSNSPLNKNITLSTIKKQSVAIKNTFNKNKNANKQQKIITNKPLDNSSTPKIYHQSIVPFLPSELLKDKKYDRKQTHSIVQKTKSKSDQFFIGNAFDEEEYIYDHNPSEVELSSCFKDYLNNNEYEVVKLWIGKPGIEIKTKEQLQNLTNYAMKGVKYFGWGTNRTTSVLTDETDLHLDWASFLATIDLGKYKNKIKCALFRMAFIGNEYFSGSYHNHFLKFVDSSEKIRLEVPIDVSRYDATYLQKEPVWLNGQGGLPTLNTQFHNDSGGTCCRCFGKPTAKIEQYGYNNHESLFYNYNDDLYSGMYATVFGDEDIAKINQSKELLVYNGGQDSMVDYVLLELLVKKN